MNFTLQFLSYIREVVIETINYFIRIVRDCSTNQYRCRLTFIEVTDINNILNTKPVLGPLLFLLYINYLRNISKVLDFYLFADDTNIYYKSDNLDKLGRKVNKELGKPQLWLNVNL